MGQYYRGVVLGKTTDKKKKIIVREAFSPYSHDNGAKLMEHSYVGNWYVKEYERVLANEFFGFPFVWCGDYADEQYGEIPYVLACDYDYKRMLSNIKKAGYKYEESDWDAECKKYDKAGNLIDVKSEKEFRKTIPYEELENVTYDVIINFTKKQFARIPKKSKEKDKYGYPVLTIHPLPLLCASGNGRGGGDYHGGTDFNKVGIWAYDRIGIGFEDEIPAGFTELVVNFVEEY